MFPWFVYWPIFALARGLAHRSPRTAVGLCHAVASWTAGATSLGAKRLHAAATVSEAMLVSKPDVEHSLALNEQVISTYGSSSDRDLRQHVAWAMVNKGIDLNTLGKPDAAIETYRELLDRIPQSPPFLQPLAQGLMNWAITLGELGRHTEEKESYDRIQQLLSDVEDESTQRLLAWSFINKGIQLAAEEDYDRAIDLFDAVLQRWWTPTLSPATPMGVHEALAAALRHRAGSLMALRQPEAAIVDADRAIDRYLGAGDPGMEEEIAWAMLIKAAALEALRRPDEALRTFESLIARYRRSSGAQVRVAVASARRLREGLETPR